MGSNGDRKLEVAIFLMQGMWTHDLANALQIFGATFANADGDVPDPCHVTLLSRDDVVELDHGLFARTEPFSSYDGVPDVIYIPGLGNPFSASDKFLQLDFREQHSEAIEWLVAMHARGAELGAVGSGPSVLAWAGLLEDTYCTVYWRYKSAFKSLCKACGCQPKFRLSQLMVHDVEHRIWTCGGGVSGLDMCLNILREHTGRSLAYEVSKCSNVWSSRSLDTRQDALGLPQAPSAERSGREIAELTAEVHRHPERSWSIDEMAWFAGMSPRTFQRHFHKLMGQTPTRWLISERVSAACELLKSTDLPLSDIALRVGMSSAGLLRKHFTASVGETPAVYRKRMQG